MITEVIGKLTVKRHDDISELIVTRYNLFNKFALYNSETGDKPEDIERHFYKMDAQLTNGRKDDALQTRNNLRQVFHHIHQSNNFNQLQWACLVQSIDDKEVKDLSLSSLKLIMELMAEHGLTQGKVRADVEEAKKKFATNFARASRKNSGIVE